MVISPQEEHPREQQVAMCPTGCGSALDIIVYDNGYVIVGCYNCGWEADAPFSDKWLGEFRDKVESAMREILNQMPPYPKVAVKT